jgi:hypothetical protein
MTHLSRVLVALVVFAITSTATADPRTPAALAPYAEYVTYVTTFYTRTTGDGALAIARDDPSGARCFAQAANRTQRDVCQRFLQEKTLVEALPTIASAARAKLILDANPEEPSRIAMLPLGQACAESADRLADTGIAPLRKIGPYTIGMLKSKLCNALLVSAIEH